MDNEPSILFRSTTGTQAVQGPVPSATGGYDWLVAIALVSALAIAVIVLSTRWSIRSMIAAAQSAIDQVGGPSEPAATREAFRTVGIGRAEFGGAKRMVTFKGRAGDRLAAFVAAASAHAEMATEEIDGDVATVTLLASDGDMLKLRQEGLASGFTPGNQAESLSLAAAERAAEREAMADAVRALAAVAAATGKAIDPARARIRGMCVETVQVPPRDGTGPVVKRIEVSWDLGEAMSAGG